MTRDEKIKALRPCPFCGAKPTYWSCDRLIKIACPECDYSRAFDGLINNKPNEVPVHYEGGKIRETEFYHYDAEDKAIKKWNTREEPRKEPRKGYLSIDDVMTVFDDFMCGEVDEEGTETFLEMLKDKAESEGKE